MDKMWLSNNDAVIKEKDGYYLEHQHIRIKICPLHGTYSDDKMSEELVNEINDVIMLMSG